VPTTSIAVQETIPNGKYEQLGADPTNGVGSGAYSTKISLYTQVYFWTPNGRIFRLRVNASQSFSGHANVDGVSVYGTDAAFHGVAAPGTAFTLDVAQEYSITSNWVVAMDEVYNRGGNTQIVGNEGVTNSGTSYSYYLAPAIEYNWNANVGLLFGTRLVPAGRNTSATFTPALALDIVR